MSEHTELRETEAQIAEREKSRRFFRVMNAEYAGIRVVPNNPDPSKFRPIPYACHEKPTRCWRCHPAAKEGRCE